MTSIPVGRNLNETVWMVTWPKMAPSLRDLIDFLLAEIALCGDQGQLLVFSNFLPIVTVSNESPPTWPTPACAIRLIGP